MRAGDHLNGQANIEECEEGGMLVTLYLHSAVTNRVKDSLHKYLKAYAKECGWVVKKVRWSKTSLKFVTHASKIRGGAQTRSDLYPTPRRIESCTHPNRAHSRTPAPEATTTSTPQCTSPEDEVRQP